MGQRDLAVDLGTANTLVFERGRGIIVSEPSVVAVDSERGDVDAVGAEAQRRLHHDLPHREHRDLARAAADVDHHAALGLRDVHTGADRRGQGLLDQVHLTGAR